MKAWILEYKMYKNYHFLFRSMENKIILLVMLLLLILPLISAVDYSYIFQQNKETNLKIVCVDDNNVRCDSTVKCNLTIFYPNNSVLVDGGVMTYNPNYFNYTLTSAQMKVMGEYSVSVACANSYAGFSTFNYLVNPTGMAKINEGEGLSLSTSSIVIIVVGIFFFLISLTFQNPALKIVFVGLSGVMLVIAVLYSLVSITQVLGGFSAIIEGYSTFWFVLKVLVSISITALVLYGLYIAIMSWKFKRGLIT